MKAFAAALACALCFPAAALATSFELYGFGARATALAGTAEAISDDYFATFHNPANLALADKIHFGFGTDMIWNRFQIDQLHPQSQHPAVMPADNYLAHLGISTEEWTRAELTAFEAAERYQAFQDRQQREIDRSVRLTDLRIPEAFDYEEAKGLSLEARQKLHALRPLTVGHAQRIAGVTPADISGLIYHLNRKAA